jgi:hypothetical protein
MQSSYHTAKHHAENSSIISDRIRAHCSDQYGSGYEVHKTTFGIPESRVANDFGGGQKGAVDLIRYYSVGGRTRHMEIRQCYLRELK